MKRLLLTFYICALSILAHGQTPALNAYSDGLDLIKEKKYEEALTMFDRAYELASTASEEARKAMRGKGIATYFIASDLYMAQDYKAAYDKYIDASLFLKNRGMRNTLRIVHAGWHS